VFARLHETYGSQDPFEWFDGGRTGDSLFAAMVLHIIGQQISATVTMAVYDRVKVAAGSLPNAELILRLGAPRLRECGLSWAKAHSVVDLAERQSAGIVDLEHLESTPDDQVIARLTAVKGIGLWTAQTFLIRQLGREDVLPEGDVGVRRAIAAAWALPAPPIPKDVRARGEAWAPYRSFAAALLWRSLAPVGELSDPKAKALAKENSPRQRQGPGLYAPESPRLLGR
jgi:3-methyladenine DNA glycosylase/8-oxoguanine DNA glycosylase